MFIVRYLRYICSSVGTTYYFINQKELTFLATFIYMRTYNLKFVNTLMFVFTFIIGGLFFNLQNVFAITPLALTPATGGESISADIVGISFVTLTGPILEEGTKGEIKSGIISLSAPAGFEFDTSTPVSIIVTSAASDPDTNINHIASGGSITPTVTSSNISFTISSQSSSAKNTLTWTNIKVRPTAKTPLATGNITLSSTDDIIGLTFPANVGTLTEIAGTTDLVAVAFDAISTSLGELEITSNIGEVDSTNYTSFTGLYFEKSIDGVKMGRITFNGALDLSSKETQDFLTALGSKLDMSEAGTIGLDFTDNTPNDAEDDPSLKGVNATIKFYNLDKLGFTSESTSEEILSLLIAMDDAGNVINKTELLVGSGTYSAPVGACMVGGDCYTFEIPVLHFTKYKIPENSIVKEEKKDTSSNNSSGSYIQPIVAVSVLPKIIGCAPLSGHVYDVNTGKLCTNDTSIPVVKKTKTEAPIVSILNPVKQVEEISPITNEPVEEIQQNDDDDDDDDLSGREVLINSLSASAGRIGFVLKGPMLIWIILLIILILLGGGYGVYSLYKKDKKIEIKKVEAKEIPKPITPVTDTPKQETLPTNNPPVSDGTGQNTTK